MAQKCCERSFYAVLNHRTTVSSPHRETATALAEVRSLDTFFVTTATDDNNNQNRQQQRWTGACGLGETSPPCSIAAGRRSWPLAVFLHGRARLTSLHIPIPQEAMPSLVPFCSACDRFRSCSIGVPIGWGGFWLHGVHARTEK